MRILSLDLGIKSCGISISDESRIIATPLENFMFERNNFSLVVDKINELLKQYNIDLILLGYPLRTDGQKSESTLQVESFNELLKENISDSIKIKLIDETMSTQRGIELMGKKIKDKEKIKEMKDVAASYIILNDYLMLI